METPLDAEMARVFNPHLIDVKPDIAREYTITDLLHKIDPSATIDPLAENLILDIADDFIDTIVSLSADVHTRSDSTVTGNDVSFCIANKLGGMAPGSAGYSSRTQRSGIPAETYQKIQEIVDKQQG